MRGVGPTSDSAHAIERGAHPGAEVKFPSEPPPVAASSSGICELGSDGGGRVETGIRFPGCVPSAAG